MPTDPDLIPIAANGNVHAVIYSEDNVLPTAATSVLDVSFVNVGLIDEEGAAFGFNTETFGIPAWQSFYDVRRGVTSQEAEISFAMLEWNAQSLLLAFGGGTYTDNADGTLSFAPPSPDERRDFAVVIDANDGDNDYRIVVPRCSVESLDEVMLRRGEAAKLAVTLRGLASGAAPPFSIYMTKPALIPEPGSGSGV